jgi:hypothetical protein
MAQTDPTDTGIETATGEGAAEAVPDAPPDPGAAEAAAAAADQASEEQIQEIIGGGTPPKAIATPHGHEGDYVPAEHADALPEPEPEAEGSDDASDGPLDLPE